MFFDKILDTRDSLPYGYRYLCKQISRFVEARFEKKPDQLKFHLRALGYYVFYRYVILFDFQLFSPFFVNS
jgi:hypothetical protein